MKVTIKKECLSRIASMQMFVLGLAMIQLSGCAPQQSAVPAASLTGSWKAQIQFTSGAFAEVKDLAFMYSFHADGTMTESSNYDAAPPVAPAYSIWRQTGENQFEAQYEFYMTRFPDSSEHLPMSAGWMPAGHGVLHEKFTVSADGRSFTSKLRYEPFDMAGKIAAGGGEADGHGVRMEFTTSP